MSQANRLIYGCNEPNKLQNLDLQKVEKDTCIQLHALPKLRYLAINLGQFNQLLLRSNEKTWHNLTELTLNGKAWTNIDPSLFKSKKNLPFLSQHYLCGI